MTAISVSKISTTLVLILLTASLVPLGASETLFDVSLGFPHSADFNADDGGYEGTGPVIHSRLDPVSSWEWGAPTSGPGVAASGSNVWATNLAGPYGARECAALLSPPIDLTGATSASVSFAQWRHMEQSTSSTGYVYDAGMLFVTMDGGETLTPVDPVSGTDGPMSTVARGCMDGAPLNTRALGGPKGSAVPAPVYSNVGADLSAFAGSTVQFLIAFGSDASVHREGWYVDDFAVTIDGVTTVEDFEASDGGFAIVNTMPAPPAAEGWAWGDATAGPTHDSPLWATNPGGNYGMLECASLESPAFRVGDVPSELGVVGSATMYWNQWFRSNSLYAAGIVQVGALDENGDATWTTVTPDDGYPGKATGSYQDQLHACLGEDSALGAYSGTHDSVGATLNAKRLDLTPWFGQDVKVRFLFASAWSAFNPTLYPGWYVDDVEVEVRLYAEGPGVEETVGGIVDQLPLAGGRTMAPGWTSGGDDITWEWGFAASGPEGEIALATNLAGSHGMDECSWVEAPPMTGAALAADPTLRFTHWYDAYQSSYSGNAWSGGIVLASGDDGATWNIVDGGYNADAPYTDVRNCVRSLVPDAPSTNRVFSGASDGFETAEMDLSAYTDSATVKVRFVYASGIQGGRLGWYLNAVEMGGVKLL